MIKSILTITLLAKLMFSCGGSDSSTNHTTDVGGGNSGSGNGQGGSLARFAITKDHLYVVSTDNLRTYNISNLEDPTVVNSQNIGNDLETIFPRGDELFIGSMNGMYIMSLANPSSPELLSNYRHIVACDPVVANQDYAYVTLRSDEGLRCWNSINELQIISLENLRDPRLIQRMNMDNPKGLGLLNNKIFICDDKLEMYNLEDQENPVFEKSFDIDANDVIPYNDLLIVTADDGIYQYKLEGDELKLLSKIGVGS